MLRVRANWDCPIKILYNMNWTKMKDAVYTNKSGKIWTIFESYTRNSWTITIKLNKINWDVSKVSKPRGPVSKLHALISYWRRVATWPSRLRAVHIYNGGEGGSLHGWQLTPPPSPLLQAKRFPCFSPPFIKFHQMYLILRLEIWFQLNLYLSLHSFQSSTCPRGKIAAFG